MSSPPYLPIASSFPPSNFPFRSSYRWAKKSWGRTRRLRTRSLRYVMDEENGTKRGREGEKEVEWGIKRGLLERPTCSYKHTHTHRLPTPSLTDFVSPSFPPFPPPSLSRRSSARTARRSPVVTHMWPVRFLKSECLSTVSEEGGRKWLVAQT